MAQPLGPEVIQARYAAQVAEPNCSGRQKGGTSRAAEPCPERVQPPGRALGLWFGQKKGRLRRAGVKMGFEGRWQWPMH